jgi:cellulose synthase/poly-beta-1,6-N-acetylglucosamine synthase-like glycosyltransferase
MPQFWQWYDAILFWLGVANLAFLLIILGIFARGGRRIRQLALQPIADGPLPRVSVIVPARNEERNVEEALESLLRVDYENLELLVVNDRSTDRTGEILDRMAAQHPRLQIVHLSELPAGWLGKNHALQYGAERATGEWLLFTDADIVFEPTSLRRAIGYAMLHKIDHLAVGPMTHMPGWLLQSMVVTFCYLFSLFARPWDANDAKSTAHIGIGAFNLVRLEVFRAVGGMQPVAMRPDDDLKLGKLIKMNGYRQEFMSGSDMISVEWYRTIWELVVGLEKNSFAAVEYSVLAVLASTGLLLLTHVWPFVAVLVTWGPTRWVYVAVAGGLLFAAAKAAQELRIAMNRAFGFPICIALFCFINWRSMWLTLRQRGIRWRDTHYGLAELRANRI